MDYDWLSTNDFAGEAVAPLSDFCWPGRPNASPAGKSVQPVILHLSRSKPSGRRRSSDRGLARRPHGVLLRSPKRSKEKPLDLEISVSAVASSTICLLLPLLLSLSVFLSLSAEKPIMRMLDARLGDREAQEFVRRLKEIEKSMEEE